MFTKSLLALFTSLALVGCGGSDKSEDAEASALTGNEAQPQSRTFSFAGQFVRTDCVASGTHAPTQCGQDSLAGPGSFTVEFPQTLPPIAQDLTGSEKMRVKVSVKSPGILEGDAPIDVSFEADMTTSMWGTLYDARYRVIGRRFEGQSPQALFPNNPVFEGRRGVGVSAEVMANGKIDRISLSVGYTHDLDRTTALVFNAAP